MQIEIDQSGKIEQTNHVTVIALTNGVQYTILVKKNDKRLIEKEFRKHKLYKLHSQITFATLIAIIVSKSKVTKSILIDTEYPSYDNYIKKIVLDLIGNKCPTIKFGFVGKESRSDVLAGKVAHKKIKPNCIVSADEVIKIIFKKKKIEERLSQD